MTRATPRRFARSILRNSYTWLESLLFDPRILTRKWRGVPFFVRNAISYRTRNPDPGFRIRWASAHYLSHERFVLAGTTRGHYFHQDLWAARHLAQREIRHHVDVGSRLDGFVAHVLTFADVTYVDIRPVECAVEGLHFLPGSLVRLPFGTASVPSLSCLHVIEHVGLGRYGDEVDPHGHVKAAHELTRVLAPGGVLLLGTPIGHERLVFDAHRVFDPETVVAMFSDLKLQEFALIDDVGDRIHYGVDFEIARQCDYGCGLFVFTKPAAELGSLPASTAGAP